MSNGNLSCCAQGRPDNPSAVTGTVATTYGVEPSPTVIPRRWSPAIGGTFLMGSEGRRFPDDGEGPVRQVIVSEFAIACFAVSNLQFGDFVRATGYTTDAERCGWSFVFAGLLPDDFRRKIGQPGRRYTMVGSGSARLLGAAGGSPEHDP
jgi:sulfatase modifying factor 1